MSEPAWER